MPEPSIAMLSNNIEELNLLINEANTALRLPPSNVAEDFSDFLKRNINTRMVAQMYSSLSRSGRPEFLIVGGVALGALWVGAKGFDLIANTVARNKAKNALLSYYQELAVKHSLICEKQAEINRILEYKTNKQSEEYNNLRQQLRTFEELLHKIESFQKKVG